MLKKTGIYIIGMLCISIACRASVGGGVQDSSYTRFNQLVDELQHTRGNIAISTILNQLLTLYQERYTAQSPQYADCMMWCANTCADYGDNQQARQLMEKSKQLFRQCGNGKYNGRDTIQEIFRLDLESKIAYNSDADFLAVRLSRKSCELKRMYFGENSEAYLHALLELSRLYAERLKYRKSNHYHNMGYSAYVERIRQEFCSSSESERTTYWETAIKYINKTLDLAHQSGARSQRGGKHSLASAAYNAMLLSKGLLLNTTIGFEDYIVKSGNEAAIRDLRRKKLLAGQQADQSLLDSMDYVILHDLHQQGQGFQLPHLSLEWQDVVQRLSKNDLAIEFYKTEGGEYGALLIKPEWKSPKVVRLKSFVPAGKTYLPMDSAMARISLEHYDTAQDDSLWHLSKSIWTDEIIKYFPNKGNGRVFFSADGELLITGIEYLPFVKPQGSDSFHCISDLYDMYRLSSTRELAMSHTRTANTAVAVYGGLLYDMQTADMLADARQYKEDDRVADLAFQATRQQRAVREADRAIDYLSGTQKEADSIVATINHVQPATLVATPYTGVTGTEASFKALSGKQQKIIHIATHGYFYNDADSTFNRFELGNNPLVRSGLFFAGADNKWLGDSIPDGVDDGFLTALEISNLDFRGLDLVVLSACETGKGNIKGDGVFGLQRGFKMASANSILMSLWKVDDEATCLLMTEFYRNWMRGQTKHNALEQAKQAVRSHKERGWDAPKFWAAFILLDGLD